MRDSEKPDFTLAQAKKRLAESKEQREKRARLTMQLPKIDDRGVILGVEKSSNDSIRAKA